jgi:hypothetical protein
MHRTNHAHAASFKSGRPPGRREWGQNSDEQHQMEAREHARQPLKAARTRDIRDEEARRQIRELRARY